MTLYRPEIMNSDEPIGAVLEELLDDWKDLRKEVKKKVSGTIFCSRRNKRCLTPFLNLSIRNALSNRDYHSKGMKLNPAIISEPLGPGIFRRCMSCKCWFALKREEERHDNIVGKVTIYRCIKCNSVMEFAQRLPKDAI
jgi:hypothetical protein